MKENPESQGVSTTRKAPERCWFIRKLCSIVCYLIRKCFCLGTSTKIGPEKNTPRRTRSKHGSGHGDTDTAHGNETFTVLLSPEKDDNPHDKLYKPGPSQKTQPHRLGTPRKLRKDKYAPRDQVIEVEPVGDTSKATEGSAPPQPKSTKLKNRSGDQPAQPPEDQPLVSRLPRTLTINTHLTPEEVQSYLDHQFTFKLLTIEFDLRHFPPTVTSDSVFEILQMAFTHPSVLEFRIRIDNWRNYIHQKENLIPKEDIIGPLIRTDYPMKLETLIIYCPGVTLHHLLIYRGFILSQVNLSTLICNFDSVMWRFYKPILKALSGTLRKLELYSITNYNGNVADIEKFNWAHIESLPHLKCLKIWGDSRYYGLRHKNLSSWPMNQLTEIELKYVDLEIQDIEHILLSSCTLHIISLQFFTPIPIPVTLVPAVEFIEAVSAALKAQIVESLSFTDHKLPGSITERHLTLSGLSHQQGYSSIWASPDNTYDLLSFQQ